MTGLSRNGHLIKSVSYGVVAKFFGGGVAIFGLPLISYKSSPLDYQFFLVLMSLASFFSMPMGVLNYSIISRLSVYYASRDMDRIDEEVSGFWALTVFCSVFLFFLFLLIYPFLDVPFFAFFSVIMITMLHNFTRFFEAVNVAYKMDFYNSIGYLFSSAVMLAVYVFFDHIFLHDLVVSYFFVPLFFSLIPAFFCLVRPEIFFKFCSLKDSFFLVLKSADHFYIQLVEFFKVYLIPLVYVLVLGLGDEQYALILTLILFAARLVNPVSLVARPLFPAFADAVSQSDYEWIKKFVTIFMSVFSIASLFFPFLFVFYGRDFLNIVFPNYADQFSVYQYSSIALYIVSQSAFNILLPLYNSIDKLGFLSSSNFFVLSSSVFFGLGFSVFFEAELLLITFSAFNALFVVFLVSFLYRNFFHGE